MHQRFAGAALLLVATVACDQDSSSSSPTPSSPSLSCAYSLSIGTTINGYPNGGRFSAGVIASSGNCNWTAATHVPWIHITSGASGTGTGATAFTVDPNTGGARTGTLTIAGEIVTFNQSRR